MKILYVGDLCCNSGFATVGKNLLEELAQIPDVEICAMGIRYEGHPHSYPFKIYPAQPNSDFSMMGYSYLPHLIEKEEPDIVWILHDPWEVKEYVDRISKHFLQKSIGDLNLKFINTTKLFKFKICCYMPIDSIYISPHCFDFLPLIDTVFCYTRFGQEVVKNMYALLQNKPYLESSFAILGHGSNADVFCPQDIESCRKLFGFDLDSFLVFNGNTNTKRKRLDLTIKAFCIFAKNHENAKLYIHAKDSKEGWDLTSLFREECRRHGVVHSEKRLFLKAGFLKEEQLVQLYNCMDVGVNTSSGEGWGLVSMEHALCGVPQIVPNHSACSEVFSPWKNLQTNVSGYSFREDKRTQGGWIDVEHLAAQLDHLYRNRELSNTVGEKMRWYFSTLRFQWNHLAHKALDQMRG